MLFFRDLDLSTNVKLVIYEALPKGGKETSSYHLRWCQCNSDIDVFTWEISKLLIFIWFHSADFNLDIQTMQNLKVTNVLIIWFADFTLQLQTMKESYLPEMNEMYQKIANKLHQVYLQLFFYLSVFCLLCAKNVFPAKSIEFNSRLCW